MYVLCTFDPPSNTKRQLRHEQLILLIGNYMNGTGVKGGAFGFKISSINKVNSLAVFTDSSLIF
jgi:hypothetical protein